MLLEDKWKNECEAKIDEFPVYTGLYTDHDRLRQAFGLMRGRDLALLRPLLDLRRHRDTPDAARSRMPDHV